jgi:hypothetical protein
LVDYVPTAEPGHSQIDDSDVERLLVENGDGRCPILAERDFVPHAGQLDLHDIADGGFVIHEQDA